MSWIIKTQGQLKYDMEKIIHIGWQMVPGIKYIFVKKDGAVFEECIRNSITDRYYLVCSIAAHKKEHI